MKRLISLLLTITLPLWFIPLVVVMGIWDGSTKMQEFLFKKEQEKQCCTETTVEQIVLVVSCGTCIMVVSVERKGKSYEIAL